MSIVAYTGLPGAGKSYGVVENVILPSLRKGRTVYTNIPMNYDELQKDKTIKGNLVTFRNEDVTETWLDELPAGIIFVLDEAWRVYPAGVRADKMPESYKSFLAEHRHKVDENGNSNEIIFVTQDLSQLASFVRKLIEETFIVKKMSAFGKRAAKRYRVDIYTGEASGSNPPVKNRVRQLFGKYKPEIYKYYQSHTQAEGEKVGEEVKADQRGSVLKSSLVKYGVPIALVLMCSGVYKVYKFFNPDNIQKPHITQKKAQVKQTHIASSSWEPTVTSQSVNPTPAPAERQIQLSRVWRIAGTVFGVKKSVAILASPWGNRTVDIVQYCDKIEGTYDYECIVDNERVTKWSGRYTRSMISGGVENAVSTLR